MILTILERLTILQRAARYAAGMLADGIPAARTWADVRGLIAYVGFVALMSLAIMFGRQEVPEL